jgi:caa(3)-type oxidase subunit IV
MSDHPLTHEEAHEHHHPPYMKIFGILATLTLIELFIPPLIHVGWIAITSLILIAIWKMKLILGYFMHLNYYARVLLAIAAVPASLAFVLVLSLLMEFSGY